MIRQTFASLSDLVEYTRGCPGSSMDTWAGGSIADAHTLATYGWPEGANLASESACRIADRIVAGTGLAEETAIDYDTMGAAYDPGAYYSGVPECWARPMPQLSKRAIRIVTNVCVSGGVSADTIRTRGLAVAALTLALTAKGYPVTLDIQQRATRGPRNGFNTIVHVLDAASGSQIDTDRIVYAMAHPTMFRQLLRAAIIKHASGDADTWGRAAPYDDKPEGTDIYLGGAHLGDVARWRDGGEAWILAEYLKQTAEA